MISACVKDRVGINADKFSGFQPGPESMESISVESAISACGKGQVDISACSVGGGAAKTYEDDISACSLVCRRGPIMPLH